MENNNAWRGNIVADLGLDRPFVKGLNVPVRNVWHFSSDGDAVDAIFYDDDDFKSGMNRIYVLSLKCRVTILAFVLMDTHVHFVLYGDFDECNHFVHEYMRLTSMYLRHKYGEVKKLRNVPLDYQVVDTEDYLKIVICYVIKNPPVGGLPFTSYDYPWSSGSLYFRTKKSWISPASVKEDSSLKSTELGRLEKRNILHSDLPQTLNVIIIDGIVHPKEYVDVDTVERIFKTHKSFNHFLCVAKGSVVESRGGNISRLSIPIQEMRQYRDEICTELFGKKGIRHLDTASRIRLARTMKVRYNCSLKQIARLSGLVYSELKVMI